MWISRKYRIEDWKRLRFSSEDDWRQAVTIFEDRLETRYLEHVRMLLPRKTSGFAVLALDSALIETLEQFRRGTLRTPERKGREYFETFLTQTAFKTFFDIPLAALFYKTVRCGLLHQSEADGPSKIKSGDKHPLVGHTADQKGIVVNKDKFHGMLEQVVQEYVLELKKPASVAAREMFRRKMNYICRVE